MNNQCKKIRRILAAGGPAALRQDPAGQDHLVECAGCYAFLEALVNLEQAFAEIAGSVLGCEYTIDAGPDEDPDLMGGTTLKDQEKHFILKALARNGYDRIATARELGIHKATLYRKIQKFGIELPPRDARSKPED